MDVTSIFKKTEHEIEDQMYRVFRWQAPVIGFSGQGKKVGVGKIIAQEDRWKDDISKLMDRAKWIVCLPSPNPGTLWEIKNILANRYLSKTLVIMPPEKNKRKKSKYKPREDWNKAQELLSTSNIILPDYDPEGKIMYFGESSAPLLVSGYSTGQIWSLRRFVSNAEDVRNNLGATTQSSPTIQ